MHTFISIEPGTKVLIGSAARPMAAETSGAILKGVLAIPGVVAADLPQMFALGVIDKPQQVLRVSVDRLAEHKALNSSLNSVLSTVVPKEWNLLVLVQAASSGT